MIWPDGRGAVWLFLCSLLIYCSSCQFPKDESYQAIAALPVHRSFYHWQTEFSLSPEEQVWLDSLHIDQLYVKFFDLDWDPGTSSVVPLASLDLDTSGISNRKIIPTIFITNRSMLQISPEDIPILARRMIEKIDRLFQVLDQSLGEVQIDCDWTARSRSNYFSLLDHLQSLYRQRKVVLSTTIRLHQLHRPKQTGVPPVERGVLMFYNMGDLPNWQESNSILNLDKAAVYLPDDLSYPFPIDLALPLFRWAVLFRNGEMFKLINEPTTSLFMQENKYLQISSNRYEVLESTYLDGYYLYRGDQLRIESVSIAALQEALDLISSQFPAATQNLIWYHLDTAVIERYDWKEIGRLEPRK